MHNVAANILPRDYKSQLLDSYLVAEHSQVFHKHIMTVHGFNSIRVEPGSILVVYIKISLF